MIYDTATGRLKQLDARFGDRTSLLYFLGRLREDVSAIRQQYPENFDNSWLQKDIEEYHTFSLVYARLARRDLIAYPFRLQKSESPDFLIQEGDHAYGLEATKATPEAYQRWIKQTDFDGPLQPPIDTTVLPKGAVREREAARLIQAAILRKSVLLRLYRGNSGSPRQRLIVRLQSGSVADAEALLKVLWREGLIEGAAGFERILVAASSSEFILLDPEAGGIRRL